MRAENPLVRHFKVLTVVAVTCGILIGAGLTMILNVVRICTPVAGSMGEMTCRSLDAGTKASVVTVLLLFGAMIGIIPHTEPFHNIVNRLTGRIEKGRQDADIMEYFERYYGD